VSQVRDPETIKFIMPQSLSLCLMGVCMVGVGLLEESLKVVCWW
jgi:hypothetical protein